MENNIFMFKKTGLYPLQTDITGSSTEELGRYNITKKETVLVLSPLGLHKECSECLFLDDNLKKYTIF